MAVFGSDTNAANKTVVSLESRCAFCSDVFAIMIAPSFANASVSKQERMIGFLIPRTQKINDAIEGCTEAPDIAI